MDQIRQYLLSILTASVICAILIRLTEKQNFTSAVLKLITALFLSVTLISPLLRLQLGDITSYIGDLETDANSIINDSQLAAAKGKAAIIKEQSEAYILNKAASYGIDISVCVTISDPTTMLPDSVTLEGEVSPYTKQLLQNCIAEELGIPKENQLWI